MYYMIYSPSGWKQEIGVAMDNIASNNIDKIDQQIGPSDTATLLELAYKRISEVEAEKQEQQNRIEQLEKLASTDELTGLYNRRGFITEFNRDMARLKRNPNIEGGLFILFDLNKFKQINDVYGHLTGDKALQLVGRTLLKIIRNSDTAARLGGDEFVLYLAETDKENAIKKAKAIRDTIDSLTVISSGHRIPIKTSMGFAYCTANNKFEDIYDIADKNLYQDKEVCKKLENYS